MTEYNIFAMQFGVGMCENKINGYTIKKKYYYKDKRTKKHGLQRTELLNKNKIK
tara:strand:+ start:423 stop:584 length:162 start_codon:yes stop_codon:yes gene_type:complete